MFGGCTSETLTRIPVLECAEQLGVEYHVATCARDIIPLNFGRSGSRVWKDMKMGNIPSICNSANSWMMIGTHGAILVKIEHLVLFEWFYGILHSRCWWLKSIFRFPWESKCFNCASSDVRWKVEAPKSSQKLPLPVHTCVFLEHFSPKSIVKIPPTWWFGRSARRLVKQPLRSAKRSRSFVGPDLKP